MKHLKLYIPALMFTLCGALSVTTSCNHIETFDNGDLDGFWHIVRIDTLSTNGTRDLSKLYYFWSVEYKLLAVEDKKSENSQYLFRFNHKGDSLILSEPHGYSRLEAGDVPVTDATILAPYGINDTVEPFFVELLNSNNMILRSKTLRISFRKL